MLFIQLAQKCEGEKLLKHFRKHTATPFKSIHEKFIRQCLDYWCKNVVNTGMCDVRLHAKCLKFRGVKDTSKHIVLIKLIYSRMEFVIETLPRMRGRKNNRYNPPKSNNENRIIPSKIEFTTKIQNPYASCFR